MHDMISLALEAISLAFHDASSSVALPRENVNIDIINIDMFT